MKLMILVEAIADSEAGELPDEAMKRFRTLDLPAQG